MKSEDTARIRATSETDFTVEFFVPIERTEEEIKEFSDAIECLAKNKDPFIFLTCDYDSKSYSLCADSRGKLISEFGLKTFFHKEPIPDPKFYETLKEYEKACQEWDKKPKQTTGGINLHKNEFWIDDRKWIGDKENPNFNKAIYQVSEQISETQLLDKLLNDFGNYALSKGKIMNSSNNVSIWVSRYIDENKNKLNFKLTPKK